MSEQSREALADILIVDDMPANLRLLSQMLTEQGYLVRPVLNGAQALSMAQIMPPDLILLDIRMPGMSGYEVCEQLKADERTQQIPVLFISALSDIDDKVRAFDVGGVDYITKPFQLQEILARIQTQLTVQKLHREMEQQIDDLRAYAHTVAHDLRSPISNALGVAQMMTDPDMVLDETERTEFLGMMMQSLHKANNIVKELLLLAEVRQAEVPVEQVQVGWVVAESLQRVASMIRDTSATVIQPDTWPSVLGHASWIEEIWVNYLTNAIKYGGAPPVITLGASPQADGRISKPTHLPFSYSVITLGASPQADGSVRFWVRDNGPGLTPEQQASLFTPFTRLNQTRATGFGLGLSIAQRIAHKLNGSVGVESSGVPGAGSVFYFTLPGVPSTENGGA